MSIAAHRLDAFTDAAFAFAVTLMVVGAGNGPVDLATMDAQVAALPSFAIGFAIIAMFWFSHVQWRGYRGEGDWRSVLLSLALIFVVLLYVTPLRAMATSFAAFLLGKPDAFSGKLRTLFTLYGVGFTTMAAITAGLFHDALRSVAPERRRQVGGLLGVWLIQSITGLVSTIIAQIPGGDRVAPWLYASLPVSIPLFSTLWYRERAAPAASLDDEGAFHQLAPAADMLAPHDHQPAGDDQRRADPGGGDRQRPEHKPAE